MTLTPDLLASAMGLLACAAALLMATEVIALRTELGSGGLFDWRILRTGQRWTACGVRGRALDVVLGSQGLGFAVALQMLAVGLVLWPGTTFVPLPWLLVVLAGHLLLVVRLGYAVDASDRMLTVVLAAGVAYHLASGPLARDVALWFVGAGLLLHLSIAAVMRLNHFVWAFAATYPGMIHLGGSVDGIVTR